MKIFISIILPLTFALSCGNAKEAVEKNNTPATSVKNETMAKPLNDQDRIEHSLILQEAYGGLKEEENRVITNEKGLQEAYGIINRFRRPGLPVPEVDFDKYMIVAIFLGERNTGGHSAEVSSVSLDKGNLVVNIKEHRPSPGDNTTTAICQPFCFVKISKPDKISEVVFRKM